MTIDASVKTAAASDVEDGLNLVNQPCQSSGDMLGSSPEAVAAFLHLLRSVAAASTTAAKWPQMVSKLRFKLHISTLGRVLDSTTVDISIERPNLARGIPCGPPGAAGPVRRALRGSRASLD
jgi:hypothetical protein